MTSNELVTKIETNQDNSDKDVEKIINFPTEE